MPKTKKSKECILQLKSQWENDYFCAVNASGQLYCLICGKITNRSKTYYISRHYNLLHKKDLENLDKDSRAAMLSDLKLKNASTLPNNNNTQANLLKQSLAASYSVAEIIAREKKCFSDGNVIKKGAIEMAKSFNLPETVECFKTVSLSPQTVSLRIDSIGQQIAIKLKNLLASCKYYSLCLDESTDNSDISQLSIFVRIIQNNFEINEELLALVPLYGTTKGTDIYNAVQEQVNLFIGSFDKCSAIVTDGAPAMTGNIIGFKGLLRKSGVKCLMFHCIIHQEVLCGKVLKFSETMKMVTKITNLIRGGNKSLSHRKFKSFLAEIDASYSDLLMHSEIRWLSAGKSLQRFFALRNEISIFFLNNVKNSLEIQDKFKDTSFLMELAFLTDITYHLNILNLKLQKREQNISELISHINGFRNRLHLFITELSRDELHNFPSCEEIKKELVGTNIDFSTFVPMLECVLDEFKVRFQDFNELKEDLRIFNNLMNVQIQDQKVEYRLELCDLQGDEYFLSRNEVGSDLFKLLPEDKYPKLRDLGLKICSIFGSTYDCESAFSLMKHLKSLKRTSIKASSLIHSMRIATTNIEINISDLVENAVLPQPSH